MPSLTQEQRNEMGLRGRAKMEAEFDEQILINKYLGAIEANLTSSPCNTMSECYITNSNNQTTSMETISLHDDLCIFQKLIQMLSDHVFKNG